MKRSKGTHYGPSIGGTYPEPWPLSRWASMRLLYRVLLGRPMDNVIRTNATFWHPATAGYPSRWLWLAGWQRAVTRLAALYLLAAVTLALLPTVSGTRVLLWHLPVVLAIGVPVTLAWVLRDYGLRVPARVDGSWTWLEVRQGRRAWERTYVRPLALAADKVLDTHHRVSAARSWVHVPRNFRDGGPVEVLLPASFTGADKGTMDRMSRTVSARLGLKDPIVTWELEGHAPRVRVTAAPPPPARVTFADVRRAMEAAEEYRPVIGVAAGGAVVHAEMISDSPHIAVSAGPGAGKSTLGKVLIAQALHWGWGVVICDWKQTEAYKWAEGLPGVTYLTSVEAIHDLGVRIGQEVDLRKASSLSGRAKVLVVRDEWNVTADLLMAYWQDLRATADLEERRTMPVRSPALRGFATLDFAGREFGLHDFVIGQRFSARIFNGNADIRACFAIRLLARYDVQTAKMLVGNIKLPRKDNTPGRWVVVAGEEVVQIQGAMISGEEARAFAMAGRENPITPFTSSHYPEMTQRAGMDTGLGGELGHGPARPSEIIDAEVIKELPPPDLRKLSDMVDALEPFGITLDVLRHAVKRDSVFPTPRGGTPNRGWQYDFQEVKEWARRRQAARAAEREGR